VIGLPSTGLHTNGFSLARRILDPLEWSTSHPDLGCSIGDALLQVHRCYLEPIQRLWAAGIDVRGLAHITGGGITDNLPRIIPAGLAVRIHLGSWPVLPIFTLIQQLGQVPIDEMLHVFNMGVGMLVVVPLEQAEQVLVTLPGDAYVIGELVAGEPGVQYIGLK
jgi:phosphoribosylformylglycinamidine cyclo-ligase